jgi:hypothetical protein
MKAHETNAIHLERLFEIVEEKLLENGYIAKISTEDFNLQKVLNALSEILDEGLSEEINICFNIYLESYELFTMFFSYNCKTSSFSSSYDIYPGHYSSDTEDSFIEVAIRVSSNDIKHVDSNVYKIRNVFRKHYISFYETPYYYYVNSVSTSVNTAFHLNIELERIII